jgi:glycosyltransferase involved in cell wall biosynthesis
VVDDGSDNETREIYSAYKDRIKLIELSRENKTDRTPSNARNQGFKASTGEYIAFLDSDNYYEKDFVERMIKEHYDVAMCNWEIIGKEKLNVKIENVWKHNLADIENYLRFQHLDHQCLLIKRDALLSICDGDELKLYDKRLPRSQDCDLIIRLMLKENRFRLVPHKLFVFEKHEDDQMKRLASVHGKTLWTLKNNINIAWITPMLNSHGVVMSYIKAINEFMNDSKWKDDYNKSGFKLENTEHDKLLKLERTEYVSTS